MYHKGRGEERSEYIDERYCEIAAQGLAQAVLPLEGDAVMAAEAAPLWAETEVLTR